MRSVCQSQSVQWIQRLRQLAKAVPRAAAVAGASIVINSFVVHTSAAQVTALPQPEYSLKDENSVDLLSFNVYLALTDVSIGSKEHPLTHLTFSGPDGSWFAAQAQGFLPFDSFSASIVWPGSNNYNVCSPTQPVYVSVTFASAKEYFFGCHTLTAVDPNGSTLTYNSDGTTANYVGHDGTIILFNGNAPQQILYPDGRVLTYWYYNDGTNAPTLKSVTRSDGLQLKYTYVQSSAGWWSLATVTAINNAYEYCNPTASTCSLTMAWPAANYSFGVPPSGVGSYLNITDAAGRVTRYTTDGKSIVNYPKLGRTVGIKLPSSATADNFTYTYCDSNCPQYSFEGSYGVQYQDYVLGVVRDGQTWSYGGTPGSPTNAQCGIATYGFTNPVGNTKQVTLNNCLPNTPVVLLPGTSPLIQLRDEDGVQFNMGRQGVQLQNAIKPEGNQTNYLWDARGNITQETLVPKSGSPLAQVTLSANYPCSGSAVTCNEPTWVKDGLVNETDYTYDQTHGEVLTKTLPADANGIRPQTTYTYSQRYAWVLNSSGSYVKSAAPIWVLATETICRTSATTQTGCAVAGDQVVKTYEYGPDSGPNNLFLRGVAITADGVTHRTCYGYDPYGNKISETEADAGLTSCP